jgi:hypothetical protein
VPICDLGSCPIRAATATTTPHPFVTVASRLRFRRGTEWHNKNSATLFVAGLKHTLTAQREPHYSLRPMIMPMVIIGLCCCATTPAFFPTFSRLCCRRGLKDAEHHKAPKELQAVPEHGLAHL